MARVCNITTGSSSPQRRRTGPERKNFDACEMRIERKK